MLDKGAPRNEDLPFLINSKQEFQQVEIITNNIIKLSLDISQSSRIIKTQSLHHRKRRLHSKSYTSAKNQYIDSKPYHHFDKVGNWRELIINSNETLSNTSSVREGAKSSFTLSSCDVLSWIGDIAIGIPTQNFEVRFDTGSSDLVVFSSNSSHHLRGRDINESTHLTKSYKKNVLKEERSRHENNFELQLNEKMNNREFSTDIVYLTPTLKINNQSFAQALKHQESSSCRGVEGTMGLAFSEGAHKPNALVQNLQYVLEKPIFSMYLHRAFDNQSEKAAIVYEHPASLQSQLILGGIDHKLYEGCLAWHSLLGGESQPRQKERNRSSNKPEYWDFAISEVIFKTKGLHTNVSKYQVKNHQAIRARIDSGSVNIIAPNFAISFIANAIGGTCIVLEEDGSFSEKNIVSCERETTKQFGSTESIESFFDIVVVNCSINFPPLQFKAKDMKNRQEILYELKKEDLLLQIENELFGHEMVRKLNHKRKRSHQNNIIAFEDDESRQKFQNESYMDEKKFSDHIKQELCMLRIVPSHDPQALGWTLGDPFLNKYYSAYDVANQKVGFAKASNKMRNVLASSNVCKDDIFIDIMHNREHELGKEDSVIIRNDENRLTAHRKFHDGVHLILPLFLILLFIMLVTIYLQRLEKCGFLIQVNDYDEDDKGDSDDDNDEFEKPEDSSNARNINELHPLKTEFV